MAFARRSRCPSLDRHLQFAHHGARVLGPYVMESAARKRMVPSGVSALLVCHDTYRTSSKPVRLLEAKLLGARGTVRTLVNELNTLPAEPPGTPAGTVPMCLLDRGASLSVWAEYPHRAPLQVSVDETGCFGATNGYVSGWAAGGPIPLINKLLQKS
jgi:hypothetical protein